MTAIREQIWGYSLHLVKELFQPNSPTRVASRGHEISDKPPIDARKVVSLSPEARRRKRDRLRKEFHRHMGPGSRFFEVVRRTVSGTWNDGFIHAGNLAYMSLLALFPFFILGAAIFSAIGEDGERAASINAVLFALPPMVGNVIEPVARNVIEARSGLLLWVGGAVGLWTVSSLIETIRDVLRRAYGTEPALAFWRYRLLSIGLIVAAVVLLILSLFTQVLIGAAQEVISAYLPLLDNALSGLSLSRIVPALGLFGSLYLLFFTLTPQAYRARQYPKWPGALFAALWWVAVSAALPPLLKQFFVYDLTYGSLAGIMIALFFFWLVGLGLVAGAELNAALAEPSDDDEEGGEANGDEMQEGHTG